MDGIREYLISVVAGCMITVIADVLIQKSALKKIVRLIGGILVLLVAIRPLMSLDMEKVSTYFDQINTTYRFDSTNIKRTQDEILRKQVRESAENYIEKEAKAIGGTLQAEVKLSEGDYPEPVSVTLIGTLTPEQIETLSAYIETTLNIPPSRQEWRLYG
ncbi:MAG: stage III sporulation protein AF [Oscillospiraceae bacterium]|nr:stage III sporulation protein AF [Oscillospiraceae bacterium]